MKRETIRDELAKAICAADDIWPPESRNGNSPNGLQWGLSIKRADAVLQRLDSLGMVVVPRVATEAMKDAPIDSERPGKRLGEPYSMEHEHPEDVWKAMVDAALAE